MNTHAGRLTGLVKAGHLADPDLLGMHISAQAQLGQEIPTRPLAINEGTIMPWFGTIFFSRYTMALS